MLLFSGLEDFFSQIPFYEFILLLGGIGVLLIGMQMMSGSLEKLANDKLRKMLNGITNSKMKGLGIGTATTAIIQSSTATTVMTVSLVNVGIITLVQAVPIIMGANIGTTLTGLIAALQDSNTDYTIILFLLALIGVIFMLTKKDSLRTLGAVLAGLGLLFIGLWIMSSAMRDLGNYPWFNDLFVNIQNPFLLLFIGFAVTAIIQSSTAVTGLLIAMASGDIIFGGGGNAVLYVILGTNIGTCLTTMFSAIGTSTNAKRTAVIHLLYNLIGSVIVFVILLFWPNFNAVTFEAWFPNWVAMQIAMFHAAFNVASALMLPLSGWYVWMATKLVPEKANDKDILRMAFISDRFLATPSIAVSQVIKELGRTTRAAEEALNMAIEAFVENKSENLKEIVRKKEEVKFYTQNITKFLVKISSEGISYKDEKTIGSCYNAVIDIDRIADYAHNIVRYYETMKLEGLELSETAVNEIQNMYSTIKQQFESTVYMFESRRKNRIEEIETREDEIDNWKRTLTKNHIDRLTAGECNANSSSIFINLIGNLERVGDHLVSIARTVLV